MIIRQNMISSITTCSWINNKLYYRLTGPDKKDRQIRQYTQYNTYFKGDNYTNASITWTHTV